MHRNTLRALALALAAGACVAPAAGRPHAQQPQNMPRRVGESGGAPPCRGNDPRVAVPSAPHGMYVWAPGSRAIKLMSQYVIGKDPTLCGVSVVVTWAEVEPSKGRYTFDVVEQAVKPFTDAHLTVNLLFAEATEGTEQITPAWVMSEVPATKCGTPQVPLYWNRVFEDDWRALMSHAIAYFSRSSPIADDIGYMRFATGAGAEAVAPPGAYGGKCAASLHSLGYSYQVWKAHELRMLDAMASTPSTHQLMVALPQVPGGPTLLDLPNAFAAAAAAKGIGLSFESLGAGDVAAPGTTPAPCRPRAPKMHWCTPFHTYAGRVPLAMQPITASMHTNAARMDITNLLQYALDNKIQIFELYPDEWLEANAGAAWQPFEPAKQAEYQSALRAASMVLGASGA